MNVTNANATSTRMEEAQRNPAFLLALAFMVTAATLANVIAARRVAARKRREIALKDFPLGTEFLSTTDAARFPITGSAVLFGLYCAFRYLPREWLNMALSAYLVGISVFALGAALKPLAPASPLVGLIACAVGVWYLGTSHWVANNILAFGICVAGAESLPIKSFKASALMLCGLFVYDVFWVFGTDVMVTVAKNVQGPIKLLFPQDVFGDHEKKSLLGLGDIVIPGFFLMQMVRFGLLRSGGASLAYFIVALAAYVAALVNTMFVMVAFDAAQPALLYIVPWLLITTLAWASLHGESAQLLNFDEEEADKLLIERARQQCPDRLRAAEAEVEKKKKDTTLIRALLDATAGLFGLDQESLEAQARMERAKLRRM